MLLRHQMMELLCNAVQLSVTSVYHDHTLHVLLHQCDLRKWKCPLTEKFFDSINGNENRNEKIMKNGNERKRKT